MRVFSVQRGSQPLLHNSMIARIMAETKPTFMTGLGVVSAGGNIAVWMDVIKGWAAFATVLIGVPTAILILCYWAIKTRNAWVNRSKRIDD